MSERHEKEKAKHDYRQFLSRLRGPRAQNTGPGVPDLPVLPSKEVKYEDVLKCFLAEHPEYEPFADSLRECHGKHEVLSVDQEKWKEKIGADNTGD